MISAIPTRYAGVNFRSRLEARWATFFDLQHWPWEYEPVELPRYIPDFVLTGDAGQQVLVEVKPYRWPIDDSGVIVNDLRRLDACWGQLQCAVWDGPKLALGDGPASGTRVGAVLGCTQLRLWRFLEFPEGDLGWFWREAGNMTQWRAVQPR